MTPAEALERVKRLHGNLIGGNGGLAKDRAALAVVLDLLASKDEEAKEAEEIAERDGYERAVQDIDLLTGGDGEYRASSDSERHTPDPAAMKRRIADRIASKDEEIERLRLAICGGEDAPGYAMSLPLQAILDVAEQNTSSWFSASDEAQSTEARNVSLSLENEGLRAAAAELLEAGLDFYVGASDPMNEPLSEGQSNLDMDYVSACHKRWKAANARHGKARAALRAALSPPPPEGLEGKQGLSSPSREPSPSTCAAPVASDVAGQQRGLNVLIAPDALIERIRQAFLAGCEAVQANYRPDPDPDFKEASYDYVASLDFTDDTRPIRERQP